MESLKKHPTELLWESDPIPVFRSGKHSKGRRRPKNWRRNKKRRAKQARRARRRTRGQR